MKVSVLSSGSKGNTTYIETDDAKILIDIGNTSKYVKEKLEDIGVRPEELDAILITHTHIDHVKGLKAFKKKYNIPVYISDSMHNNLGYLEEYVLLEEVLYIKDICINVIKTSHDTEDSRGFILTNNDSSIVYITDTGYINKKYYELLSNRDLYIMESNHDIEMLNNSRYPFQLRQRILSDKGHLSNYDSSKYISSFIGDKTKYVLLAHLSEENNTEKLAHDTLINRLKEENKKTPNIIVTKQDKETELISI